MTIEDRNLAAGTRLAATYKKLTYKCRVEVGEEGKLAFVLEDGRRFKSPSSAASAVMGGKAVNGWIFWSVAGQEPEIAEEPASAAPKTAAKQKRRIYRLPNQKGVAEGKSRWFCSECRKSFIVDAGAEPVACPEGHLDAARELTSPLALAKGLEPQLR